MLAGVSGSTSKLQWCPRRSVSNVSFLTDFSVIDGGCDHCDHHRRTLASKSSRSAQRVHSYTRDSLLLRSWSEPRSRFQERTSELGVRYCPNLVPMTALRSETTRTCRPHNLPSRTTCWPKSEPPLCHCTSLRNVIELKGRSIFSFHTNLHLPRTIAETPASAAQKQECRIHSTWSILR